MFIKTTLTVLAVGAGTVLPLGAIAQEVSQSCFWLDDTGQVVDLSALCGTAPARPAPTPPAPGAANPTGDARTPESILPEAQRRTVVAPSTPEPIVETPASEETVPPPSNTNRLRTSRSTSPALVPSPLRQ
ncbi:MAG: hypothetical protein HC890_06615 [Chloroflexaceae bacterium]|nr:hypothetical protein [Chloroflexaceae bacterium]